jgi:hypothetical protein
MLTSSKAEGISRFLFEFKFSSDEATKKGKEEENVGKPRKLSELKKRKK